MPLAMMPGVARHFALPASTLYHFAGGWPWQNRHFPDHSMEEEEEIHNVHTASKGL